ncbi:MAG: T9SS type A sorting domain-containing protein, partial [Ignavibacteriaceae bacterium]|nr:T9SS type A sorting domain-containing protein [Ignavibacteriaceae bacterium]
NPNTVIRFEIPGQARNDNVLVTLKIYDILGNEVASLVNEEKQAGVYEVEFDASSLASGMYLYKLQAGGFVQTKKMILLR